MFERDGKESLCEEWGGEVSEQHISAFENEGGPLIALHLHL